MSFAKLKHRERKVSPVGKRVNFEYEKRVDGIDSFEEICTKNVDCQPSSEELDTKRSANRLKYVTQVDVVDSRIVEQVG